MLPDPEWRALSSRLRGLLEAARFLFVAGAKDIYGGGPNLQQQLKRAFEDVARLSRRSPTLPQPAAVALEQFVESYSPLFEETGGSEEIGLEKLRAKLTILAGFESEITYLLADPQETRRLLAERAFTHLQRSIVVDADFRVKWALALEQGETECEKLGAVHLLLHGIWAFKVDSAGGRTDLVFQEPLADLHQVQRVSDGLVLTEWKIARSTSQVVRRFEKARNQAERYSAGVLAGIELSTHRFAIVVSESAAPVPADAVLGEVVYRHILVVTNPPPPSRAGAA